jgi:HK97 gp10 family phage protein
MDDVTMEITGLQELQLALEQLPHKVAQKGLRVALKGGGALIEEGMVQLAPKDTGFMSEHFNTRVKISRDELSATAYVGPQGKIDYPAYASGAYRILRNANGRIRKVGKIAVATIARFLEFGTSKMSKHPFMTQAFETRVKPALEVIIQKLTVAVEQAAKETYKGSSSSPK